MRPVLFTTDTMSPGEDVRVRPTPVEDGTAGLLRQGDAQIFGHAQLRAETAVAADVVLADIFVGEHLLTVSSCRGQT